MFIFFAEGNTAGKDIRAAELRLECAVSRLIGNMPFLWLAIEHEAGPDSMRGWIERNSIALLSNFNKPLLDAPSGSWLGKYCDSERVRAAGLWNSNHVNESEYPAFLDDLGHLVAQTAESS